MENEILIRAKSELANKPKQLVDIDIWLFVAVNTARALIDSMNKNDLSNTNLTSVNPILLINSVKVYDVF